MGKGSKPSTPPPSAQEMALADISVDIADDYKNNYRVLEGDLLELASRDRTNLAQGRSNVDTQKALAANENVAISRGATSGGMGSGASLSALDAGSTGGALATSNQEAYTAGRNENTRKTQSAIGAVQEGQDVSFAGIRTAADVGNRNTINKFSSDQTKKIQNAQLAEGVISGAVSGYMKGQNYMANKDALEKAKNLQAQPMSQQLGAGLTGGTQGFAGWNNALANFNSSAYPQPPQQPLIFRR